MLLFRACCLNEYSPERQAAKWMSDATLNSNISSLLPLQGIFWMRGNDAKVQESKKVEASKQLYNDVSDTTFPKRPNVHYTKL